MSDGIFDFNSMWVRSGQSAGTDTAHAFRNFVEIYTQFFVVGQTYSQVALNITGIDEIRFNYTGFNVVMDASDPRRGPLWVELGHRAERSSRKTIRHLSVRSTLG